MAELSPVARALLETIAGPESKGDYNVIYGGSQFDDFSDHPRKAVPIMSGPNKGRTSSAAGKYQFIGSTWDDVSSRHGIPDFSPESQDKAAWALATEEYKRDTGRDLEADLAAGDLSRVAPSLRNQWTSLPGGIEQGIGGTAFANAYASNLGSPNSALGAINSAAGAKKPNFLQMAMQGIRGGVGGFAQQAQPTVMRAAQRAAPSIMQAALGSIAGRSAIIDPMIQKVFSNGSVMTPALMASAQRAVSQSGDTSVGNQAEAAATRASAQSYRDSRR